jgi:precorrin-3B synthase
MTAADACPGLLDLHEAGDGYVARIRLPGGYAGASRLAALAALASRFGSGFVDLTARGNVQIRGVRAGEAGELARRAARAGLLPSAAHDRARNITASPLAGLAGHRDLHRLVRALDRALLADPGLAMLPGRFLFGLDDGTGRAGLSSCDVGVRRGTRRADLIVAGRETGLRGPAEQMVRRAIAAARAFARQREAAPAVMRMTGLPDGGAAIAAALGGKLGEPAADTVSRLPLGPLPAAAPSDLTAARSDPAAAPSELTVVVTAAPLARLTVPQLRLLGRLVRPGEAARLTAAGRIVLPLADPAETALLRLADAGLLVSDDHVLAAVTACSGLSCASALADVRSQAARIAGLAAVHWAGCGRRCGLPADATAVVATSADEFAVAGQPFSAGQLAGADQAAAGDGVPRALTSAAGTR